MKFIEVLASNYLPFGLIGCVDYKIPNKPGGLNAIRNKSGMVTSSLLYLIRIAGVEGLRRIQNDNQRHRKL